MGLMTGFPLFRPQSEDERQFAGDRAEREKEAKATLARGLPDWKIRFFTMLFLVLSYV